MSEPPLFQLSMEAVIPAAIRKLFNACIEGDLEAVTKIVELDGVDLKATATLQYSVNSSETVKDASPLFVSAYYGHYEIVRYLVRKGADIFAKTSEFSSCLAGLTPLYGSVEQSHPTVSTRQQVDAIVRFLLEAAGSNSSALLTTTPAGETNPIWMMYGCGLKATITLINYGMSLNEKNEDEETILHYWAAKSLCYSSDESEEGSVLELVQLLVEKGIDLTTPDFNGHSPLFLAACGGNHIQQNLNFSVFDYLLEREEIGRLDKINALELAGASILSFSSDATQIPRAFEYWRRAHHLRYLLVGADPIPKEPIIFEKTPQRVEWTTLPQLEEIENDPSQHKIASLLVHLRMLSVFDEWTYGRSYLQKRLVLYPYEEGLHQGFTEAVDSLLIALDFILDYEPEQVLLWRDTVEIVAKLVSLLDENPLRCTPEILKASVELITAADLMRPPFLAARIDEMYRYIKILLQFVFVLAYHQDKINNSIMDALTQLVRQNRETNGFDLLLVAVELHLIPPTIRLLLRAQANPNVVNRRLSGPLHILATWNTFWDQEHINNIGNVLVEAADEGNCGAHPYMVDDEGRTAADIWLLVRNQGPQQENHRVLNRNDIPGWCLEGVPKLKCLAAKTVRRFRIPYADQLPATLDTFMDKH